MDALAECVDISITFRAGAEPTILMVIARIGQATYLSAEQLQANKKLGAKAAATMVECLIKHR